MRPESRRERTMLNRERAALFSVFSAGFVAGFLFCAFVMLIGDVIKFAASL